MGGASRNRKEVERNEVICRGIKDRKKEGEKKAGGNTYLTCIIVGSLETVLALAWSELGGGCVLCKYGRCKYVAKSRFIEAAGPYYGLFSCFRFFVKTHRNTKTEWRMKAAGEGNGRWVYSAP